MFSGKGWEEDMICLCFVFRLAFTPQAHRKWVEKHPRQTQAPMQWVGKLPLRPWWESSAKRLPWGLHDSALPMAGEQTARCSQVAAAPQPDKTSTPISLSPFFVFCINHATEGTAAGFHDAVIERQKDEAHPKGQPRLFYMAQGFSLQGFFLAHDSFQLRRFLQRDITAILSKPMEALQSGTKRPQITAYKHKHSVQVITHSPYGQAHKNQLQFHYAIGDNTNVGVICRERKYFFDFL